MKNIDQIGQISVRNKKSWCGLCYSLLLFSLLNLNNLAKAQSYSDENQRNVKTEVIIGDFLSQLDKKTGVKLPQGYDIKVDDMLKNNDVMKNKYTREFTEKFIVEEMSNDWKISKQNQLLFIRDAIYFGMENKELYDGEDGDENRLNEFEIAVDFADKCGNNYMKRLKAYMIQTTDSLRQRTEETIRHTMSLDTVGLVEITRFYNLYTKDPSSVTAGDLDQAKKNAAHIISDCKRYGIDYKQLLSPEVRRFYGIE